MLQAAGAVHKKVLLRVFSHHWYNSIKACGTAVAQISGGQTPGRQLCQTFLLPTLLCMSASDGVCELIASIHAVLVSMRAVLTVCLSGIQLSRRIVKKKTTTAVGVACRLVPQTNAVVASYTISRNNLSSTIAHNFAKDMTTLSATKKLARGQAVKAVYGMKDKTALIELAQAPFTASPCSPHISCFQHKCNPLVTPVWLQLMLS